MLEEVFEAVDRFQGELAGVLPEGSRGMLFDRTLSLEELEQVFELAALDRA